VIKKYFPPLCCHPPWLVQVLLRISVCSDHRTTNALYTHGTLALSNHLKKDHYFQKCYNRDKQASRQRKHYFPLKFSVLLFGDELKRQLLLNLGSCFSPPPQAEVISTDMCTAELFYPLSTERRKQTIFENTFLSTPGFANCQQGSVSRKIHVA